MGDVGSNPDPLAAGHILAFASRLLNKWSRSNMIVQAAFEARGQWFRGNLHTHSTASDGKRTPAEVVDYYRRGGYDFVVLTDHLVFADIAPHNNRVGFLTIPGIEIHGEDPHSRFYHIVGLGGDFQPGQTLKPLDSFQEDIDRLRRHGALVHLAHPYWSGQLSHDLIAADGAFGVEVYNGTCDVGVHKGFSHQNWDDMLSAGRRVYGLAVDDAHWLPHRDDAAQGWVMVKAEELTAPAILEALRLGRFYSTLGPTIRDVRIEGDEVAIACSPATTVVAVGDRWLCSVANTSGSRGLTEARFRLWEGQAYVRAEVIDYAGKVAWSNPIFLNRS